MSYPLGTSRRKHKLCAIYWVLSNLHPKYHTSVHFIELKQRSVYVEQLGASIKGTVFFIFVADNLVAYFLRGFFETLIKCYIAMGKEIQKFHQALSNQQQKKLMTDVSKSYCRMQSWLNSTVFELAREILPL